METVHSSGTNIYSTSPHGATIKEVRHRHLYHFESLGSHEVTCLHKTMQKQRNLTNTTKPFNDKVALVSGRMRKIHIRPYASNNATDANVKSPLPTSEKQHMAKKLFLYIPVIKMCVFNMFQILVSNNCVQQATELQQ